MAKDTFYFPHDYNSRTDIKIKKLILKMGFEGYGIWWALVEDLYNNANALPLDYEGIAYDLRTEKDKIEIIINSFDLFIIEDGFFGSISIGKRLQERNEKSKKAQFSAFKRWSKDAIALRTHSDSNAIKEIKEKKEIKEILPPLAKSESFISFETWIKKNALDVSRMKEPFTQIQYEKLIEKFDKIFISSMLMTMHNYNQLLSKNKSAYYTFLNWAKRENLNNPPTSKAIKLNI